LWRCNSKGFRNLDGDTPQQFMARGPRFCARFSLFLAPGVKAASIGPVSYWGIVTAMGRRFDYRNNEAKKLLVMEWVNSADLLGRKRDPALGRAPASPPFGGHFSAQPS